MRSALALAAFAASMGSPALAQDGGGSTAPKSTKECEAAVSAEALRLCAAFNGLSTDMMSINAIPTSPAFTILNVTPSEIVRPTTPRQFGAAILNGADPNGNLQAGLAIDTAPYMLFAGQRLSLQQYRADWFTRFLANTQLSLATAKGESDDDKSFRAAAGLHFTLWNAADPRLDARHSDCVFAELSKLLPKEPPLAPSASEEAQFARLKAREEQLANNVAPCHEELRKRQWSASAWSVGLAGISASETGKMSDFGYGGAGAWMSFALDLGDFLPALPDFRGQLTLHGRWRDNEFTPDPSAQGRLIRQDSAIAAAALRLGTSEFNVSLEPAYLHSSVKGRGKDDYFQFTASTEYHLFENIWLNLAIGGTTERDINGDTVFVMGKLKYGFDRRPGSEGKKPPG